MTQSQTALRHPYQSYFVARTRDWFPSSQISLSTTALHMSLPKLFGPPPSIGQVNFQDKLNPFWYRETLSASVQPNYSTPKDCDINLNNNAWLWNQGITGILKVCPKMSILLRKKKSLDPWASPSGDALQITWNYNMGAHKTMGHVAITLQIVFIVVVHDLHTGQLVNTFIFQQNTHSQLTSVDNKPVHDVWCTVQLWP